MWGAARCSKNERKDSSPTLPPTSRRSHRLYAQGTVKTSCTRRSSSRSRRLRNGAESSIPSAVSPDGAWSCSSGREMPESTSGCFIAWTSHGAPKTNRKPEFLVKPKECAKRNQFTGSQWFTPKHTQQKHPKNPACNKTLRSTIGAPGIATRSKSLTSSNKKILDHPRAGVLGCVAREQVEVRRTEPISPPQVRR